MLFRISSLWFCLTSAVCHCLARSLLSFLGLNRPLGSEVVQVHVQTHTHTCVRTCTDALTCAKAITKKLLCITCCKTQTSVAPVSRGKDGPLLAHRRPWGSIRPCTVHACGACAGGRPLGRTSVDSGVGLGVQTTGSAHAWTPVWEATSLVAVTAPAWGTAALERNGACGPRWLAEWPRTCLTYPKPQAPPASGSVMRRGCAGKVGCMVEGHCQSSHHLATKTPMGKDWRLARGLGLSPSACAGSAS